MSSNKILPNQMSNAPTQQFLSRQKSFGRYKVIEKIGEGGMGKVYKVHDPKLDRVLALKTLIFNSEMELDIKRFQREAKTMAKLHHPRIVAIHDIDEQDGTIFFTMDYIDGPTLRKFSKKKLTYQQICKIMIEIAEAIHYAHTQGIIHRDLKPSNIVIDQNGKPKVMDFGVAKVLDTENISQVGTILGTFQYMPPEQAEGQRLAIDERSDVYALGAMLYELLTGRPPFTGDPFQMIYKISNRKPPKPSTIKSSIPKKLEQVCLKAIEKNQDLRYQNAALFAKDLEDFNNRKNIVVEHKSKIIVVVVFVMIIVTLKLFSGPEKTQTNSPKIKIHSKKISKKKKATKIQPKEHSPFDDKDLWQSCWNKEQRLFDFTNRKWVELPVQKQIKYAKIYQKWYALKKLGLPSVSYTFSKSQASFTMALIPPGKFLMGSPPQELYRLARERQHPVVLSEPYWLGTSEVTREQWQKIMKTNPSTFKAKKENAHKLPVESVAWGQCRDFCTKMGPQFALPTEAQWEYACRAGTTSAYPWGNSFRRDTHNSFSFWAERNVMNREEALPLKKIVDAKGPLPEKYFKPNGFGLYNMIGNVAEWCSDWYNVNEYFKRSGAVNPQGPVRGTKHVFRGAGWRSSGHGCRSAYRSQLPPHIIKKFILGFRLTARYKQE